MISCLQREPAAGDPSIRIQGEAIMKKSLVVLSVFLVIAAFMPRPAAAAVDFGLKGGLALSNMTWSGGGPADSYDNISKPVFGAFVAFNLSPMMAIQPEIYYWTGGASAEEFDDPDTYKMELLLNYIHVPVLAKFRFGTGQLKPILFAGPAVSFLTTATEKMYFNGEFEDEMDIKPFLKSTDFSAVFGTGLEYAMSKITLILDIRYNLGFTNINNKGEDTSIKNKAWMFMLGIGF
jgi:hypothetical protein